MQIDTAFLVIKILTLSMFWIMYLYKCKYNQSSTIIGEYMHSIYQINWTYDQTQPCVILIDL